MAVAKLHIVGQVGWWNDADSLTEDILYQCNNQQPESIEATISSKGGSAYEGLIMSSALRRFGCNVTTKAYGICASAATQIFAAGNVRITTADTLFNVHFPYSPDARGTAEDLRKEADSLEQLQNLYAARYAANCGNTSEFWLDIMRADKMMTAAEALEIGLVTSIETSIPISQMKASEQFAKLVALLGGGNAKAEAADPVSYTLQTDQGEVIVHNEGNGLVVGDMVTNPDGSPVGDGTYTPANGGDKFRVEGGKIVEVLREMEDSADADAEIDAVIEAAAVVIESQGAELATVKAQLAEAQAKLTEATEKKTAREAHLERINAALGTQKDRWAEKPSQNNNTQAAVPGAAGDAKAAKANPFDAKTQPKLHEIYEKINPQK